MGEGKEKKNSAAAWELVETSGESAEHVMEKDMALLRSLMQLASLFCIFINGILA